MKTERLTESNFKIIDNHIHLEVNLYNQILPIKISLSEDNINIESIDKEIYSPVKADGYKFIKKHLTLILLKNQKDLYFDIDSMILKDINTRIKSNINFITCKNLMEFNLSISQDGKINVKILDILLNTDKVIEDLLLIKNAYFKEINNEFNIKIEITKPFR